MKGCLAMTNSVLRSLAMGILIGLSTHILYLLFDKKVEPDLEGLFRGFEQQRAYHKTITDNAHKVVSLQAENDRLKSQKSKVITQIKTVESKVDSDEKALKVNLDIPNIDDLVKRANQNIKPNMDLVACKTSLDGATKTVADLQKDVDLRKSLSMDTSKQLSNLQLQISTYKNSLGTAENRVNQLRRRKFRFGPGFGVGLHLRGGGISPSVSTGVYMIWSR